MDDLLIDPEFRELIPPLSADERMGLEERIARDGCRDALVVWRNGKDTLLDGHNRYEICTRLGIAYKTTLIDLPDREHAKLWITENQLSRRNLSDDQRAIIADEAREMRSKLAINEKLKRARDVKAGESSMSDASTDIEKRDIRAEVAHEANIPERKLRYAAELKRRAPELRERVRAGELTIIQAMRQVRHTDTLQRFASIEAVEAQKLNGTFGAIVTDPPWPIARLGYDEARLEAQMLDYPQMSVDEIEREVSDMLTAHAAEDCHVFLWTTQRFLPDAIRLVGLWGLKYCCIFTWYKNGGPQPLGLPQFNSEFCIYARKGSPAFIDTKAFMTCFEAQRGANSEKPEFFYDMIRRCTGGRRLDMFGRRKIEGFESWGKEAPAQGRCDGGLVE